VLRSVLGVWVGGLVIGRINFCKRVVYGCESYDGIEAFYDIVPGGFNFL
jgi:hypothetical protein